MDFSTEFIDLPAADLLSWMADSKREGWQFVQLAATASETGVDMFYTLRRGAKVLTATVKNVQTYDRIQSITGIYLAAFVFENEAHDLFGVNIDGIAIDYGGKFYKLAVDSPMTVVTPEKLAQREKGRKLVAVKDAKAAKAAAGRSCAVPAAKAPLQSAGDAVPEQKAERARAKRRAIREGRLAQWEMEQALAKEACDE